MMNRDAGPVYNGSLSGVMKMYDLATQLRVHSTGYENTPAEQQEVNHQLNAIRVEINTLRNNNVDYNADEPEANLSKDSARKMITSAQRTIIKFAGQSMEAQANMSNERIMGLLH